ncbi:hypothetical protein RRG08_014685 [Elysia crispata]|uniref:Secreted protein n=1 Tax=Elysia crispata TaxID=231223 RepID=A0AAE0YHM6_9GAST|nr:hypothetical protein RRG08_014685 [Elysia crispata]
MCVNRLTLNFLALLVYEGLPSRGVGESLAAEADDSHQTRTTKSKPKRLLMCLLIPSALSPQEPFCCQEYKRIDSTLFLAQAPPQDAVNSSQRTWATHRISSPNQNKEKKYIAFSLSLSKQEEIP